LDRRSVRARQRAPWERRGFPRSGYLPVPVVRPGTAVGSRAVSILPVLVVRWLCVSALVHLCHPAFVPRRTQTTRFAALGDRQDAGAPRRPSPPRAWCNSGVSGYGRTCGCARMKQAISPRAPTFFVGALGRSWRSSGAAPARPLAPQRNGDVHAACMGPSLVVSFAVSLLRPTTREAASSKGFGRPTPWPTGTGRYPLRGNPRRSLGRARDLATSRKGLYGQDNQRPSAADAAD